MYDQQQGFNQYGQPINPAYNPNPNMQPNPFNNAYPAQPMPIYVLISLLSKPHQLISTSTTVLTIWGALSVDARPKQSS